MKKCAQRLTTNGAQFAQLAFLLLATPKPSWQGVDALQTSLNDIEMDHLH
jgi:hypothetical protein